MLTKEMARERIEDIRIHNKHFGCYYNDEDIVDLMIHAYEQGCIEGVEDYRERCNPTDELEWERSRC
jgi:hypothetical protein